MSTLPNTNDSGDSNDDNINENNKRELTTENNDISNQNKKVKTEDGSENSPSVNTTESTVDTNGVQLALPKIDDKKKVTKKGSATGSTTGGSNKKKDSTSSFAQQQKQKMDPNKMQDVLFSAGVDIREEEALLNSSINNSKNLQAAQLQSQSIKVPKHPPFLHPDQVAAMMKRVVKEQNFRDNGEFIKNPEILNMMSSACENYMRDIITNALVISRHRRKAVQINSGRRSEISVALRAIALQQKKDEERRVKKRIALGLEKEDYENKIDSEETLHRASNVTAGLRAGSKKQYGWLTSSVGKPTTAGVKSTGRVASDIAARGDSGLRYREAREEPGIVMRDLLNALENRRIGVHNVISKGYARIRD